MLNQTTPDFDLRQAFELQTIAEQAAGVGCWSLDIVSGREYCSPGLYRLLELDPDVASSGIVAWQSVLHPADADAATSLIKQSIKEHMPFRATYPITLSHSGTRWIEFHGQATYDAKASPIHFSGYCIDVTDRRSAEEEYREIRERQSFLLKLSDALAPLSDPIQIQVEACRVLGQHLKVNRVFYAEADNTGLNRAGPQYVDGVPLTAEVWNSRDYDPSLLARYQSGEMQTCDDVTKNPDLSEAQKDAYTTDHIIAWAAAPIAKPGMPLGRLVIHQNTPRHWRQFEIDLIRETAERVWPAVQRAKSQAALELTENIPVGTYTMVLAPGSTAAKFSFLSKRFLGITGLNAEEARSDPLKVFTCVHPDDYDAFVTKNADAIAKGLPFIGETRIIVRDEVSWIRAESAPRSMPDGSTIWEGVLIDVTEQRRAEEALQLSEERYRLIAEITQEAWWEEDLRVRELTNSPRICEMLGRGQEILHCSAAAYRDLIHPDDQPRSRVAYERAINENTDYRAIYRLRHADGHYVWVEDHARVIRRDAEARPTRMLGALTDITARKQAEIALQESEENFRRLFDDAPDAYIILDQNRLEVLACNLASERLLRGNRQQITGMNTQQLSPPHQPDGRPSTEAAADMTRQILEKGYLRFEWVLRRIDGTDFWAEVMATVGHYRQRDVLYVSLREIGEIIAAKQAAEAASVAKSQFLSVMSHELRTPLNAIMNMFQLIMLSGVDEKARDYSLRGLKSSEHLLSLVTEVLDFSSIEVGRLAVSQAPFRLGPLLDEVNSLRAGKSAADVEFTVTLDHALQDLVLMGDALRLKQVLINLAGNAMKFTERGTVVLSVNRVDGTPDAPLLEFAVADTGIGMTADQQARLFQPFTQVDMSNERRFGGTGLGLVISQQLVKLMGGEPITVRSAPGVGSRFAFRLALPVAAHVPPGEAEPANADRPALAGRLPGLRILVVEDSDTARFALRLFLEAEGAAVEEAADGDAGVNAVLSAATPFDAVLMDMQMPKKNGLEATRELRARGYEHPIIALTANAFARDLEACLAAGMNDYISKPVKMDELVEAVRRNCRG